jgi:hypothetical protein
MTFVVDVGCFLSVFLPMFVGLYPTYVYTYTHFLFSCRSHHSHHLSRSFSLHSFTLSCSLSSFVKHDLKGSVEVYRVENWTHYPGLPHRPWPTASQTVTDSITDRDRHLQSVTDRDRQHHRPSPTPSQTVTDTITDRHRHHHRQWPTPSQIVTDSITDRHRHHHRRWPTASQSVTDTYRPSQTVINIAILGVTKRNLRV